MDCKKTDRCKNLTTGMNVTLMLHSSDSGVFWHASVNLVIVASDLLDVLCTCWWYPKVIVWGYVQKSHLIYHWENTAQKSGSGNTQYKPHCQKTNGLK